MTRPRELCHLFPVLDMWILLHQSLGLSEVGRARGVVGRQALSESGTKPRPSRPLRPPRIHQPRVVPSAATIGEGGIETHTMEFLGLHQLQQSTSRLQDHPQDGVHLHHRDIRDLEVEVLFVHHRSLNRSSNASRGPEVGRLTLNQPGTQVRFPAPLEGWHRFQTRPAPHSAIQSWFSK